MSGPLDQAELDRLWDFGDPALSERRFVQAQATEPDPGRRAELRTQQARAVGLQERFAEARSLLAGVEPLTPAVEVRLLLEQGRVRNSSGRPAEAAPLFAQAAALAREHEMTFLAVDALHMLAIADPDAAPERTRAALALLGTTTDRRTRRWAISLHNNLGWSLHDAGRYDEALAEFQAAHAESREVGTTEQEFIARWAIARCLRSLGRSAEALQMQRRLAAEDPTDPYVAEEIALLTSETGH